MITPELFLRCYDELHYKEACLGKTDVELSLSKSECDKEAIVSLYESRDWQLFDISTRSVCCGQKEVKADWKTGWHGERLELVPAGTGSEPAYEDVVGSDGEWHRGKRMTVSVDDIREHWVLHFKRNEDDFKKHEENEKKMIELREVVGNYDPTLARANNAYQVGETARLERVYLSKNREPGFGLPNILLIPGALIGAAAGFYRWVLSEGDKGGPTYSLAMTGAMWGLYIGVALIALGLLFLILAFRRRAAFRRKMAQWVSGQIDIDGAREEYMQGCKERSAVAERLLNEVY